MYYCHLYYSTYDVTSAYKHHFLKTLLHQILDNLWQNIEYISVSYLFHYNYYFFQDFFQETPKPIFSHDFSKKLKLYFCIIMRSQGLRIANILSHSVIFWGYQKNLLVNNKRKTSWKLFFLVKNFLRIWQKKEKL